MNWNIISWNYFYVSVLDTVFQKSVWDVWFGDLKLS